MIAPKYSLPPGTKAVLIPIEQPGAAVSRLFAASEQHELSGTPYVPVLPMGLLLWGVQPETIVQAIAVGQHLAGMASADGIPGRYFEQDRSFEELRELADRGELQGAINPRRVLECREAAPDAKVQIIIKGPFEHLCLWGLTYAGDKIPTRMTIVEAEGGRFRGQVYQRGLAGDRLLFEASSPTIESVTELLVHGGP